MFKAKFSLLVVNRWQIVSQITGPAVFQMLTCKNVEDIWHLLFEEECLNMNWNGNLDSSIVRAPG